MLLFYSKRACFTNIFTTLCFPKEGQPMSSVPFSAWPCLKVNIRLPEAIHSPAHISSCRRLLIHSGDSTAQHGAGRAVGAVGNREPPTIIHTIRHVYSSNGGRKQWNKHPQEAQEEGATPWIHHCVPFRHWEDWWRRTKWRRRSRREKLRRRG